jgi:hypothetical protein
MIEQAPSPKKMVAPALPMRQLSPMRKLRIFASLAITLSGCGLPAPYQTYTPDQVAAPTPPTTPLVVYGATTTLPDMVPDAGEIEPVPAPASPTSAPAGNRVAICYNLLWNKPDTIKSAAAQACGNAPAPQVMSQRIDLDACPLLVPTKAVFACSTSTTPAR